MENYHNVGWFINGDNDMIYVILKMYSIDYC